MPDESITKFIWGKWGIPDLSIDANRRIPRSRGIENSHIISVWTAEIFRKKGLSPGAYWGHRLAEMIPIRIKAAVIENTESCRDFRADVATVDDYWSARLNDRSGQICRRIVRRSLDLDAFIGVKK